MVALGAPLISFSGVYVNLAHVTLTIAGFYRVLFGGFVLLFIVGLRREKKRTHPINEFGLTALQR